jgi:hypothetical protein
VIVSAYGDMANIRAAMNRGHRRIRRAGRRPASRRLAQYHLKLLLTLTGAIGTRIEMA